MPSPVFRTASSSVVPLNDDRVMEVRRGVIRGSALVDRRTWESKEAWLSAVGETELPDRKASLSEDMKLMISLARRYGAGKMTIPTNTAEMQKLAVDILIAKHATDCLDRRMLKGGLYQVPRGYLDLEGRPAQLGFWFDPPCVPATQAEMNELKARLAGHFARTQARYTQLKAQRVADLKSGRLIKELVPYSTLSLYVGCDDGQIRPVYYNATHTLCGVHISATDFRVGRTFEELGIRPIGWYSRCAVTQALTQIKDLSYR